MFVFTSSSAVVILRNCSQLIRLWLQQVVVVVGFCDFGFKIFSKDLKYVFEILNRYKLDFLDKVRNYSCMKNKSWTFTALDSAEWSSEIKQSKIFRFLEPIFSSKINKPNKKSIKLHNSHRILT